MTPAQLQTLKTAILADPSLAARPDTPDDNQSIADAFNAPAAPAFWVWRTSVETSAIMAGGFVWTEVDNLTVGKARIWDWMSRVGTISPSNQNVRDGLVACFGGTSGTATAVLPLLRRNATRAEKLYAAGTGSAASPATMGLEGLVDYQDVGTARSL